ncbi:hypothetical protein HBH42_150220 [Parastagonospora nodorum]|nr:hypothetical protein HBH42_150220 [Parastagonospora nodorum]
MPRLPTDSEPCADRTAQEDQNPSRRGQSSSGWALLKIGWSLISSPTGRSIHLKLLGGTDTRVEQNTRSRHGASGKENAASGLDVVDDALTSF